MPTGKPFCGLSGMRALKIIRGHSQQSHASLLRTAWSVFTSPENGKAVRHIGKRLLNKRPANLLDQKVSLFVCVVFSYQREGCAPPIGSALIQILKKFGLAYDSHHAQALTSQSQLKGQLRCLT